MLTLNSLSVYAPKSALSMVFCIIPSPRATPVRPCLKHIENIAVAASQTLNQDSTSEPRDAEKI